MDNQLVVSNGQSAIVYDDSRVDLIKRTIAKGATDDELEATIRTCLDAKWKEHPPMERLVELHNRSMIQIGG